MACQQCELNDCDCDAPDEAETGCPHCGDQDPDHCWECGDHDCTGHAEENAGG